MTESGVYERILDELAAGEMTERQRQVFGVLRRVYPSAISRRELVLQLDGYWPDDINGDRCDRKNRKAIQALRDMKIPIVSSSSQAGYRLDVSEEMIKAMIAEWESRRRELRDRIYKAEQLIVMIHQVGLETIPSELPANEDAEQLSLM